MSEPTIEAQMRAAIPEAIMVLRALLKSGDENVRLEAAAALLNVMQWDVSEMSERWRYSEDQES